MASIPKLRMMFFLKWLARPEIAPKDQLKLRKSLLSSPRRMIPLKLRDLTMQLQLRNPTEKVPRRRR